MQSHPLAKHVALVARRAEQPRQEDVVFAERGVTTTEGVWRIAALAAHDRRRPVCNRKQSVKKSSRNHTQWQIACVLAQRIEARVHWVAPCHQCRAGWGAPLVDVAISNAGAYCSVSARIMGAMDSSSTKRYQGSSGRSSGSSSRQAAAAAAAAGSQSLEHKPLRGESINRRRLRLGVAAIPGVVLPPIVGQHEADLQRRRPIWQNISIKHKQLEDCFLRGAWQCQRQQPACQRRQQLPLRAARAPRTPSGPPFDSPRVAVKSALLAASGWSCLGAPGLLPAHSGCSLYIWYSY